MSPKIDIAVNKTINIQSLVLKIMLENIVCKFGGSSISGGAERLKRIILDDPRRKVIVVSAPGKSYQEDKKVTDKLIEIIDRKEIRTSHGIKMPDGIYQEARSPDYIAAVSKSIFGNYTHAFGTTAYNFEEWFNETLAKRIHNLPDGGKEAEDAVKAFGEEATAKIFVEFLGVGAEYVDAGEILKVKPHQAGGKILEESEELIKQRLVGNKLYVVPGFYGRTLNDKIVTFSRGGSDLTGAYIAVALGFVYENFTDSDGIKSVNPKIIRDAKKIDVMTYEEIRDLSVSGFSIFHEEAMIPLRKGRIPVHVRNTFTYPSEGTWIVSDRISNAERPIVGIGYRDNLCAFNIESLGMNEEVGTVCNLLTVFKNRNIPIEFITTGIDDTAIILNRNKLPSDPTAVDDIMRELQNHLANYPLVDFEEHLSGVVIAGKGLKGRRGILADTADTLSNQGINIRFMSQGPRENSMVYGIESVDLERAIKAIYKKYLV